MTWPIQVASHSSGTWSIGLGMTISPPRRWVTEPAQCQRTTTAMLTARIRSTVRSRPAGVAATRPSSDRLAARSAATGDPAIVITSTSSCRASRLVSDAHAKGRKVCRAGQWLNAKTESGPYSHPRSRTVSALRSGRKCHDSNADCNGHRSIRPASVEFTDPRLHFPAAPGLSRPSGASRWSSRGGSDILVDAEKIVGVVPVFHLGEPVVVRPVGGLHTGLTFVAQVVDVYRVGQ